MVPYKRIILVCHEPHLNSALTGTILRTAHAFPFTLSTFEVIPYQIWSENFCRIAIPQRPKVSSGRLVLRLTGKIQAYPAGWMKRSPPLLVSPWVRGTHILNSRRRAKSIRVGTIRAVDRLAAGLGRGECSTRQKNHKHSSESTRISAPPFRQPNTPVHGVMSFASWYITGSTTTGTTMPYHQGIFRL